MSHPDYPALISLIDLLDRGNMAYRAIRETGLGKSNLNYPLLAHGSNEGLEYLSIIDDSKDWDEKRQSAEWTGILVYPEKGAHWNTDGNIQYVRQERIDKNTSTTFMLAGLGLFIRSIFQFPHILYNIFGFFPLFGVAISLSAFSVEHGFQNQMTKKFCGTGIADGCEYIAKSKYARGIAGITPADASVIYFCIQFMTYLAACLNPHFFPISILLSFAALPSVVWSIYIQAFKVKAWCPLCIAISTIIVLQGVAACFIFEADIYNVEIADFLFLCFLLGIIFFVVKRAIKANIQNKIRLTELNKWKADAKLFAQRWSQEQPIAPVSSGNQLVIGDAGAPFEFLIVCNPYCVPCAKAHRQLDKLLSKFPRKLKIQIVLYFNPNDDNDDRKMAASSILQKAASVSGNVQLQTMIADWFTCMNFKVWNDKWTPDPTIDVSSMLHLHGQWVSSHNITFTPTIFLNGRKIPQLYSIEDFDILMPQLSETDLKTAT